jgi:tetratricopeptide (TPR) repeat protein
LTTLAAAKVRISTLLDLHRDEEAAHLVREQLAVAPNDHQLLCYLGLALRRTDQGGALDAAMRAVHAQPDADWPQRLTAQLLVERGAPAAALPYAGRALALAPDLPEAHLMMASVLASLNRLQEAVTEADKVIALAPNRTMGYVERSRLAIRFRDWDGTMSWARKALEIDPNNWAALNNLAVGLQGVGRKAEALELYARAAALNPREEVAARNARSVARNLGTFGGVSGGLVFLVVMLVRIIGLAGAAWAAGALVLAVAGFYFWQREVHRRATASLPAHLQRFVRDEQRRRRRESFRFKDPKLRRLLITLLIIGVFVVIIAVIGPTDPAPTFPPVSVPSIPISVPTISIPTIPPPSTSSTTTGPG